MKKIILAALMVISASVSAQEKTETVNLSFSSLHYLRGNEVQVAASTVCLDGKLFAVAVKKDNSGKDASGVALTQIFETRRTGVNSNVASYHVDCKDKKEVVSDKK